MLAKLERHLESILTLERAVADWVEQVVKSHGLGAYTFQVTSVCPAQTAVMILDRNGAFIGECALADAMELRGMGQTTTIEYADPRFLERAERCLKNRLRRYN